MTKKVAILQSNYIPWKGYFDVINSVDEFILYDDVQYTRRDWRNRNRINSPHGSLWLTIPVEAKGKYFQKIKDTVVSDSAWRTKHWETLSHIYGRAPKFRDYMTFLKEMYLGSNERSLSKINYAWLSGICGLLGIKTTISWSMDYQLPAVDPTERLIAICLQAGAGEYLSGPAAKAYLNEEAFRRAHINLRYMDYSGYPEYSQLYPPFDHHVSILDLLLMEGENSTKFMLSFPREGALRLAS